VERAQDELVAPARGAEIHASRRQLLEPPAAHERAEARCVSLDLSLDLGGGEKVRVRPRRLLARRRSRRVDHRVLAEQHEVAFASEMDDRCESRRLARPGNGAVERPVELDRRGVALDTRPPTGDARELPRIDRGEHRVPGRRQPIEPFAEANLDAARCGAIDEQLREPARAALDAWKAVALTERREQEPEGAAEDAPRRDVRVERVPQEQPVREPVGPQAQQLRGARLEREHQCRPHLRERRREPAQQRRLDSLPPFHRLRPRRAHRRLGRVA